MFIGGNTMCKNNFKLLGLVSAIALLGLSGVASAGEITTMDNATGTPGYAGWNLDNVEVLTFKDDIGTLTDTPFDVSDGSYDAGYLTFDSNVYGVGAATTTPLLMGVLHGKDYPVGEPAGIKVIHGDTAVKEPKPQNCILNTSYLDTGFLDNPPLQSTTCSSDFQTHKRFKVNMQPASLDTNQDITDYEGAVDLVFNVAANGVSTDYQMFQKMNNYTGKRLEGFAIQVGVGTGTAFKTAESTIGLTKLSIWASEKLNDEDKDNIWYEDQIATFSHGLFGPIDKNFPEEGFFDSRTAGFLLDPNNWPKEAGIGDTLKSGMPMENNYAALPVPDAPAPIDSQFGPWLYAEIAPAGIFFDDDGDPSTDAELVAFWGDVTGDGTTFAWMRGQKNGFAKVEPSVLSAWDTDPLYAVDIIEDTLNLGLNYIVTVGTVDASWPDWDPNTSSATFTIRMIPIEDSSGTPDPAYSLNEGEFLPSGIIPDRGTVHVAASPEFFIGDLLTITVADSTPDMGAPSVTAENLNNADIEDGIVMTEVTAGYFSGTIATSGDASHGGLDGVLYAQPGDVIKVTYSDMNPLNDVFASTTSVAEATTFFVVPIPGGGAAVFDL